MSHTKISVSQDTLDWLREERDSLLTQVQKGQADCEGYNPDPVNPLTSPISLDAFIRHLLCQRRTNRLRDQRKQAKRKANKK